MKNNENNYQKGDEFFEQKKSKNVCKIKNEKTNMLNIAIDDPRTQKMRKTELTMNQLEIIDRTNEKIFPIDEIELSEIEKIDENIDKSFEIDEIELSEIEKIDENIDKSFENDLEDIGIKPKNDIKNAKTEKITSKTNCKII